MNKEELLVALQKEVADFNKIVATQKGDWIVKGFIDVYKKIYTITIDTKVVSKVLEILLIPAFEIFAQKNNLTLELPPQQNFYPDLTFTSKKTGEKFAVDIKSTYRENEKFIKNPMTLGTYTGYFRDRKSVNKCHYPYSDYSCHYVFGVIYSQIKVNPNEKTMFTIEDLGKIESVVKDFQFFVQPKYKIASDIPGSGNTKNIGSIKEIEKLIAGQGVFANLGEAIFDDYWMFYLNNDMSRKTGLPRAYNTLKTYSEYKNKGVDILKDHKEEIDKHSEEELSAENSEEDDE